MSLFSKPARVISYILTGTGVFLFAVNIALEWTLNIALPLVFLVLGSGFFFLVPYWKNRWYWASLFYIPGALLVSFGVIFLLNVLTGDWRSWAYAWLLLVAGIGVGLVMAGREKHWHIAVTLTGWGMAIAGITFFVVFGAIAGGIFIQVMAPILIILAGFGVYWMRHETRKPAAIQVNSQSSPRVNTAPPADEISNYNLEPLSSREIEVLVLIDEGLTNQQIAMRLSVAQSTVKTHINNIYGKLGVQSRVQAVNRARDLRLIQTQ
jgi:DNA-binding CsgD family transcriptional regulator